MEVSYSVGKFIGFEAVVRAGEIVTTMSVKFRRLPGADSCMGDRFQEVRIQRSPLERHKIDINSCLNAAIH